VEKAVELVSFRVRVRVAVPKYKPQVFPAAERAPPVADAIKGKRQVFFSADAPTETTIIDRDKLSVATTFAGPAIVEQFDATTVVPPGWTASVDRYRNLVLERER
jgi:N-methylhydantoinase A